MKTSNNFVNEIASITVAGWSNDNKSSQNRPTHGGNVDIKFHDGSSIRLPFSFWVNPKAERNRPQVGGTIDKYKVQQLMDTIEKFAGDCPIDNPALRNDPIKRNDSEFENRDEVHDKATAKKISKVA